MVVPRDAVAEAGTTRLHMVRTAPFQIASYPVTLASQRTFSRIVSSLQPDVIHVQTLARLGIAATIYARRSGVPVILTWHTDVLAYRDAFPVLNVIIPVTYLTWCSYSGPAMLDAIRVVTRSVFGRDVTSEHARMLAAVVSAFDTVIVPSAKAAGWMREILGCQAKIATVPSAVLAEAPMSGTDVAILEGIRQAFPRAERSIMFVGRLSPEKNLDTLLFALQRSVLPRCPGLELIVVGAQPCRDPRYQRLAATLGIDSVVRFVGAVPNAVVRQLLAGCVALVMPSRTETQGLVLLEAALAGVPSVVLDTSLEGLVENETTGLLASSSQELSECICRLVLDPELRSRLGEAARKRAVSYSPAVFASRVVKFYQSSQALPTAGGGHAREMQ